jgi:hypothetical protein
VASMTDGLLFRSPLQLSHLGESPADESDAECLRSRALAEKAMKKAD